MVRLPFLARPVALPVLFRLQAKRKDGKHELAAQLIALIARHHTDRRIDLVGDGHYTGPALVCQPNVTLTARTLVKRRGRPQVCAGERRQTRHPRAMGAGEAALARADRG